MAMRLLVVVVVELGVVMMVELGVVVWEAAVVVVVWGGGEENKGVSWVDLVGLGKRYGGAKPEPPSAMFQARFGGRPGREGSSVRRPTSRLKRRSHSRLSAAVWFQGSSL
jgi:hypothetical protein